MKPLLLSLVVLAFALPASAQASVKNPWRVTFCWDGKDDGSVLIPAGTVIQVQVKVDGTAQPLVTLPASSGQGTCAAGSSAYTVSGFSAAKGAHVAVGALVSPDGAAVDSDPNSFTVVGRPPSKVTALQVIQ